MRILILIEWLSNIGGCEKYAISLTKLLLKKKIDVTLCIACTEIHEYWLRDLEINEIPYFTLDLRNDSRLMNKYVKTKILELSSYIDTNLINIVHCIPYERTSFLLSKHYCELKTNRKTYIIGQEPCYGLSSHNWWYSKKILKQYINNFDIIQIHSGVVKENLQIDFDLQKPIFICPAFSEDIFNNKFSKNQQAKTFRLGFMGRLHYQKDPKTILRAITLIKENLDFELIFWGDGPLKEDIINSIKKLKLEEKVFVKGNYPNIDTAMNSFDVLISTSVFEGLGLSILEALGHGKKAILTKEGALYDSNILPRNTKWIRWFDKGDFYELGNIILEMSNELNRNYTEEILHVIENEFSIDKCFNIHMGLYMSVIKA